MKEENKTISEEKIKELGLQEDDKEILEIIFSIHESKKSEVLELKDNEKFTMLNYGKIRKYQTGDLSVQSLKKRFKKYVKAELFKRFVKKEGEIYKVFIYPTPEFHDLYKRVESQRTINLKKYIALQIKKIQAKQAKTNNTIVAAKLNKINMKDLNNKPWTAKSVAAFINENMGEK